MNMTESAFWKGTSHSKKLCDLVVRLRKLEMDTGMILHVIHVSGRRMILSGVDGLSRGDHTTGIVAGTTLEITSHSSWMLLSAPLP